MLATKVPLAATAGTPIPGHIESPVQTNPFNGVFGPANVSLPEQRRKTNRAGGGLRTRHTSGAQQVTSGRRAPFFERPSPRVITFQRCHNIMGCQHTAKRQLTSKRRGLHDANDAYEGQYLAFRRARISEKPVQANFKPLLQVRFVGVLVEN